MSTDILPTLAGYTGVEPPQRYLDGRDLGAVIRSSAAPGPRATMYWTYLDAWAVREGPWKLTVEGEDGFLANLDNDPGEVRNVGDERPDIVQSFVDKLNRWKEGLADRRSAAVFKRATTRCSPTVR